MDLPESVKKQAKEADDLFNQQFDSGKTTEEPVTPEEKTVVAEETVVEKEEPTAIPAEDLSKKLEEELRAKEEELRKTEHSLDVLKGKYNAEVPRLQKDLKEIRNTLAVVHEKEQKETSNEILGSLSDEYGPELANKINSLVEGKLSSALESKIQPVEDKVNSIADMTVKNEKDRFIETLDTLVPTWREIKDEPDFIKYLDEFDAFSGKTKLALAQEAQEALDARRVAYFYSTYSASKGKESGNGNKSREKLVGPEGSSKASVTPHETEIVTTEEIRRFYHDLTHGSFKGTPEERKAIEDKINMAVKEGKVV